MSLTWRAARNPVLLHLASGGTGMGGVYDGSGGLVIGSGGFVTGTGGLIGTGAWAPGASERAPPLQFLLHGSHHRN